MLVLALQFSKGDAGDSRRVDHGSGARGSCPREVRPAKRRGQLPQNGREDKVCRFDSNGGEPTTFDSLRPTHQCTNWELVRYGSDELPTNARTVLLRKEVIQPHLPVRLPCYDFTPITDPTFDGSFLAVRPPASGVADFRGVTGGVYKARERIHPGVLIRDY